MIKPKDPAYYSASEHHDPGNARRPASTFIVHKPGVMTIELEIASRILANSDVLNSGLSRQESLIKESIAVARKLIEEANK